MGTVGIILVIDDGVYVCIFNPLFSKNLHNIHFYMTVIFQNYRRVNSVVQSLIIYYMHPSVYWREKIEKEKLL